MYSLPFHNPLSFRTFLAQSHGAALVFTEEGHLTGAQTNETIKVFSNTDFVVGLGNPPRLVAVAELDSIWRVTYYDIFNTIENIVLVDISDGLELIDLCVCQRSGEDTVLFLTESENGLSAFILDQNNRLSPVNGWMEQTIFGDLDLDLYVDQVSRLPEPDLYRTRTQGVYEQMLDGKILSLGYGLLLESFEAETAQCIRCYSYVGNGDLKRLWSDFNCVNGRIENAESVAVVKKLAGARQRLELRAAADGATQWIGPEGHVSFGLRQKDRLHVATADTIDGVVSSVISLSDGRRIETCQLCPAIDIRWDVLELPFGGEALFLLPRSIRGAVVSLHGGPESFEWSNLRYGGLYREFLASNLCVVIFNYTGSTESGAKCRTAGHRGFCNAVLQEF